MTVACYRELNVWKDGIALTAAVYQLTAEFPKHELYGLTSQLRRCAVSIPSNIAEGHARHSTREYLRHISIALGSLAELETQLHISQQLTYGQQHLILQLLSEADRLGKQLRNLTKSLRARISKPNPH
jgi:four helix bundle protein